jgi:hypothetical protein
VADLSKLTRDQAIALRGALDLVGTAANSALERQVFACYISADKNELDFTIVRGGSVQWSKPAAVQPRVLWGIR